MTNVIILGASGNIAGRVIDNLSMAGRRIITASMMKRAPLPAQPGASVCTTRQEGSLQQKELPAGKEITCLEPIHVETTCMPITVKDNIVKSGRSLFFIEAAGVSLFQQMSRPPGDRNTHRLPLMKHSTSRSIFPPAFFH